MLAVKVGFLVVRLVGRELMAPHQTAFHQKVKSIVERGPAHVVVLGLHARVQRFYVKVPNLGIHLA